jgi:small conductance mechanosensitive channel
MSQDEYFSSIILDQIRVLRVDAFNESGVAIKVLGETLPLKQWEVAGEFRRLTKQALLHEGIEIPFPHHTIYWGAGPESPADQPYRGSAANSYKAEPVLVDRVMEQGDNTYGDEDER